MSALHSIEDRLAGEVTVLARATAEMHSFVGLLAHEVRTRLQVTAHGLAQGDEAGLQTARESTWTLQDLAEDLLELARARPETRADGGEAMAWVLRDLAHADTEIVVRDLPTVALAPALLQTVLRNLVVNALEAGAAVVEVFSRPDGTVCVRDDGVGVSPTAAARIFGAYSGKFGGAGLGLTLCRQILRQRGGELWLEPPSTFCFRAQ